jgi:extracellular factor (EF) 3-hydroxypalmitic acid methyl ester biosynthesis protein
MDAAEKWLREHAPHTNTEPRAPIMSSVTTVLGAPLPTADAAASQVQSPADRTLWASCRRTLDELLAAAHAGFLPSSVWAVIEHMEMWRRARPERWRDLVHEVCRTHPFWALMQQCPMTARAHDKPRGYAGDAVMLDFIYDRRKPMLEPLPQQGEQVFRTLVESATCGSVDYRRHVIAGAIDRIAADRAALGLGPAAVLSLACGHARELDLVRSLKDGSLGRFVACDQDPESLATLKDRYREGPVRTHPLAVRDFIAGRDAVHALGQFDLVYSAGLYDYLDQRLAARLTAVLFERVAPGGELLVANFHAQHRGTGYMEAFMDWWLIYRDDEEMRALCADIDGHQVAGVDLFHDPFGNVAYLRLTRK